MENRYNLRIGNDSKIYINGEVINDEIFTQEKCGYVVEERDETINNLINWISENSSNHERELMKDDLKYLMSCTDKYLFSDVSTNSYILEETDICVFDNICEDILNLNRNGNKVMKRYNVSFLVYERVCQYIETDETDEDKIFEMAVDKATKEQEKVYWQVDNHMIGTDVEIENLSDSEIPNETKCNKGLD